MTDSSALVIEANFMLAGHGRELESHSLVALLRLAKDRLRIRRPSHRGLRILNPGPDVMALDDVFDS